MKLCPKCEKNETENKYCSECYLDLIELKDIKLKISKCEDCRRVFFQNKTYEDIDQNTFEKIIINNLSQTNCKIIEYDFEYLDEEEKEIHFDILHIKFFKIHIIYEYDLNFLENNNTSFEFEKTYKFKLTNTRCNDCQKQESNYFQGKLQVRYDPKDFEDEEKIVEFEKKILDILAPFGANISKQSLAKNGLDFLVFNRKKLEAMSSEILKNIVGKMNSSATLFSRDMQKSRNIYRTTYSVRLKNLFISDFVEYNSKAYKVVKIKKKEIICQNLETNLNENLYDKDLKKINDTYTVEILRNYPEIEVLNPIDYTPQKVIGDQKINSNKTIKVILVNNKLYRIE